MPSAIRIESAACPLTYAWVEADVVRVGSAPGNEICIPDIDPLAVTVLYQDRGFAVINRTSRTLALANRPFAPGDEVQWPKSSPLAINDQVTLRLLCQADPSPQLAALGCVQPDPEGPQLDMVARRAFRKQLIYFALTAASVFILAAVFALQPEHPLPDVWFGKVLGAVRNGELHSDPGAAEVRDMLQTAYSLEKRSARTDARAHYLTVRDRLSSSKASSVSGEAWSREAMSFVLARLERL